MQPSDFLTILGLALAVWAIIPNKERRFIRLFFSKGEIRVFVASLFFIHYLMSFDWLKTHWFPRLSVFTFENGIPSTTWAYIVSIVIIGYSGFKISTCYFSPSRLRNLISLYDSLLKENEIDLLVRYIQKYHLDDIKTFLKRRSHLPQKDGIDMLMRKSTISDRAFSELIKPHRICFAYAVYETILRNEAFVRNTANKYPYVFSTAFSGLETEKYSDKATVNLYIECLFEEKNQMFIEELRSMDKAGDSVKARHQNVNVSILFSLFAHPEASVANQVWYPVGQGTVKSLKYDLDQKTFLREEYDPALEAGLWNTKVYIGVLYFNYMVRESIYGGIRGHMWLFYYHRFIDLLINIIPNDNEYDRESEYPSFVHYIIYQQFSIMNEWLELAREREVDYRVVDTISCLGRCILSICHADEGKISSDFKQRQFHTLFLTYFSASLHPNNIGASTTRQGLENMFLNPDRTNQINRTLNDKHYLSAFQDAWITFDKVQFQDQEADGVIRRFVTNVLTPLDIEE